MNSNNNQQRPVPHQNQQTPVRRNPYQAQQRPVNQHPPAGKNMKRAPQQPNRQQPRQAQPVRRVVGPAQKNARIAVGQSRLEKIAVAGFLVLILLAVIVVAKACRGNVNDREKYQISQTQQVVEEVRDDDAPDVLSPVSDENSVPMDDEIKSKYAVMVARSDGRIIASREADTRIYPASLTKVMSLIVAVENAESLDETIVFTNDMISPFYEQNASLAGFVEGEEINLKDLLYGMILVSGADATEGVVRVIAGNEESFVSMMNAKAKELGLKDTHFVNAVGLHDKDHYSTCNEMAVILDHALNDETCREILSTYKYTTAVTEQNPEGIELTSNIQSRMEGGESEVARIHGGKTGYTEAAGNCLASFAKAYSDGEEYVIVTCLGQDVYTPIFDHINACKIYLAEEENTDESV